MPSKDVRRASEHELVVLMVNHILGVGIMGNPIILETDDVIEQGHLTGQVSDSKIIQGHVVRVALFELGMFIGFIAPVATAISTDQRHRADRTSSSVE